MMRSLFRGFLVLSIACLAAVPAWAVVTYTVSPGADNDCSDFNCDLQSAFNAAAIDGDASVLNLASGSYTAAPYSYTSSEAFPLTINGSAAGASVVDGTNVKQGMRLNVGLAGADLNVNHLTFQNGVGGASGAGLLVSADANNVTLDTNVFNSDQPTSGSFAAELETDGGSITVFGNTFTNNLKGALGGFTNTGSVTIRGNQFLNNDNPDNSGGAIGMFTTTGDFLIENNLFQNNSADEGGAIAYDAEGGVLTIQHNQFLGNKTSTGPFLESAAMLISKPIAGDILIDSNIIAGGQANGDVGGFFIQADANAGNFTIVNNVIVGNSSATGSFGGFAIQAGAATIDITNNTIAGNSATDQGGGFGVSLFEDAAVLNIYNNIVFGNSGTATHGQDIWVSPDADANNTAATVKLFNDDFTEFCFQGNLCDVASLLGANQGANLSVDPLFVNASGGDFHLQATSPVIDKGISTAPGLPSTDFDGNPRIFGAEPDMGAFEFQPPSPTPTPSATATPGPASFVSGSGCSLETGSAANSMGFGAGILFLGFAIALRKNRSARRTA